MGWNGYDGVDQHFSKEGIQPGPTSTWYFKRTRISKLLQS